MRVSVLSVVPLVALASAQTTGKLGDAVAITSNPLGASYIATLPNKASTNLRGYVLATTASGGSGVNFAVNFVGLPSEGGPFLYHIHDQPVTDGNCTSTLAHLDPFQRGEDPACDMSKPATCQVGDLSGKYGKAGLNGTTYSNSYTDAYAALVPTLGAFFGNRSIVVHFANKTRISCANFVSLSATGASPNPSAACAPVDTSSASSAASGGSSTNSPASSSSSTPTTSSGASSSKPPIVTATTAGAPPGRWINSAALLGGVAAAALML